MSVWTPELIHHCFPHAPKAGAACSLECGEPDPDILLHGGEPVHVRCLRQLADVKVDLGLPGRPIKVKRRRPRKNEEPRC